MSVGLAPFTAGRLSTTNAGAPVPTELGTVVTEDVDGVPVIVRADPVIAINLDLLVSGTLDAVRSDGDVIVFGDNVRYLPLRWDLELQALICRRVA
jgi:hypothetical protein